MALCMYRHIFPSILQILYNILLSFKICFNFINQISGVWLWFCAQQYSAKKQKYTYKNNEYGWMDG